MMQIRREEKALREFKQIIQDLVLLLQRSSGAVTACLHWVNRNREQFVLEASSTVISNVMFRDRISFSDHFLDSYKEIQKPLVLLAGEDVELTRLDHYYDKPELKQLMIIPFVNNGETVALTVLEMRENSGLDEIELSIQSYNQALGNVLNTYLELTDLYEQQQEWSEYDEKLAVISPRLHKMEILSRMMNEMQSMLPAGSVSLVTRGMEAWVNVLNADGSVMAPSLGLMIDEKSIAYESLKSGKPEFSIHFNQNPKRLSAGESETDGATLAIPLLIDDKRCATFVVSDRNPLTFKESVRHKLVNFVRLAALAIRANSGKPDPDQDLLASRYGSFIPDLWEKALESVISHPHPLRKTWFGFVGIDNLQTLRAKYRLEELQRLQKTLVRSLNPSLFGFNGYIGFYSDYVYPFILQDVDEEAPGKWVEQAGQLFSKPVTLVDGQEMKTELVTGFTVVGGKEDDLQQVLQRAKKALSNAVK
jgi:hypothetical protein